MVFVRNLAEHPVKTGREAEAMALRVRYGVPEDGLKWLHLIELACRPTVPARFLNPRNHISSAPTLSAMSKIPLVFTLCSHP